MRVVICCLACLAVVASAGILRAESIPATEIDTYTQGYNYEFSLGWRFIPTQDITVTHLGVIDGLDDGIQDLDNDGGQRVRLFTWGGGYLADVVVPTQASGLGEAAGNVDAYYVSITPITLEKDVEYMVAARVFKKDYVFSATFLNDASRPFTRTYGQATKVNYPTMPDTATDETGSGWPDDTFPIGPTSPESYYGGTFKYIPEPSALWLLLAGSLWLVAWRKRG